MTKKSKFTIVGILLLIIFATAGFAMKQSSKKDATSKLKYETNKSANSDIPSKSDESLYKDAKIYQLGDTLTFETLSLKVNSFKTTKSTSSSYTSPIIADAGTKFIIVNITVTNTTPNPFMFGPFALIDQKDRLYNSYEKTIGNIDEYIDAAMLSPSVPRTGNTIYQVPEDSKILRLGAEVGSTGIKQFVQFEVE